MLIEFKEYRDNRKFVIYKSEDYDVVGDHSEIHLRKDSEMSDIVRWVLIPLQEYDELIKELEELQYFKESIEG